MIFITNIDNLLVGKFPNFPNLAFHSISILKLESPQPPQASLAGVVVD